MSLYNSIFPLRNSWLLIISIVVGILSAALFTKNKFSWALACLFVSGFLLRLFMAHLDPFLHEWDERYHALVARNMMHDPFKPMLRVNDILPYDFKEWCCNHIWLHKQPLFLWQMAMSMKIFGVSEFAIRYPGVLMGSISILLVYRIAFLMTSNRHIAFIAAMLACYSYMQLELLSGLYGMDQNDTSFDFYVLCSIWAYVEYLGKKTLKYAILIGLFAGCAVLNKWLTGTLVFSAWGIVILLDAGKGNFGKEVLHYMLALVVCAAVFLPWQFYIFYRFPVEAAYELQYNAKHLTSVVEGHAGDYMYYLNYFDLYFGDYLYFLIPFGLLLVLFLKRYHNKITLSLAVFFLLTFIFFNFIVPTKIISYVMIVVPLGYIFIAVAVYHIVAHKNIFRYAFIPVTLTAAFLILKLPVITSKHDPANIDNNNYLDWTKQAYNNQIYKDFKKKYPGNIKYAMNVKDQINFMFYNNSTDAYGWVWRIDEMKKITEQHATIAIFRQPGIYDVPSYMADYDSLYIIPVKFK